MNSSEKLNPEKFYRLGDNPNQAERVSLGIENRELMYGSKVRTGNASDSVWVRALATGEKREPLAGEWYLSGASIVAYRAPNKLSARYHIARLVLVEFSTIKEARIING